MMTRGLNLTISWTDLSFVTAFVNTMTFFIGFVFHLHYHAILNWSGMQEMIMNVVAGVATIAVSVCITNVICDLCCQRVTTNQVAIDRLESLLNPILSVVYNDVRLKKKFDELKDAQGNKIYQTPDLFYVTKFIGRELYDSYCETKEDFNTLLKAANVLHRIRNKESHKSVDNFITEEMVRDAFVNADVFIGSILKRKRTVAANGNGKTSHPRTTMYDSILRNIGVKFGRYDKARDNLKSLKAQWEYELTKIPWKDSLCRPLTTSAANNCSATPGSQLRGGGDSQRVVNRCIDASDPPRAGAGSSPTTSPTTASAPSGGGCKSTFVTSAQHSVAQQSKSADAHAAGVSRHQFEFNNRKFCQKQRQHH